MPTLQHPPLRPSTILPPTAVSNPAVERWVWHSRFGPILIEVRGKDVFVNGDRVAPHAP